MRPYVYYAFPLFPPPLRVRLLLLPRLLLSSRCGCLGALKGSARAESIYSIQYSANHASSGDRVGIRRTSTPEASAASMSRDRLDVPYSGFGNDANGEPMTPRRIKRRSLTRSSGKTHFFVFSTRFEKHTYAKRN